MPPLSYNFTPDPLPQRSQSIPKFLAFARQHIPLADKQRYVFRERGHEGVVNGGGGGEVGGCCDAGMVYVVVGGGRGRGNGQIRVVKEAREERGHIFRGVGVCGSAVGAGEAVVEAGIPSYDGDDMGKWRCDCGGIIIVRSDERQKGRRGAQMRLQTQGVP